MGIFSLWNPGMVACCSCEISIVRESQSAEVYLRKVGNARGFRSGTNSKKKRAKKDYHYASTLA